MAGSGSEASEALMAEEQLSEYEKARLARIEENKRMLVALGIEEASSQCRHKTPAASKSKARAGPPPLSDVQRAALARAEQWLERFECWLRGECSRANADKVMERVSELVSGRGVALKGGVEPAYLGRAVSISDDLVALKEHATAAYGALDNGGWHLRHPIGKLIKFQQVLFSSGGGGATSEAASSSDDLESGGGTPSSSSGAAAGWLVEGAAVEVEMDEEGLRGSRYGATFLGFADEARRVARLQYTHLTAEEGGEERQLVEEAAVAIQQPMSNALMTVGAAGRGGALRAAAAEPARNPRLVEPAAARRAVRAVARGRVVGGGRVREAQAAQAARRARPVRGVLRDVRRGRGDRGCWSAPPEARAGARREWARPPTGC